MLYRFINNALYVGRAYYVHEIISIKFKSQQNGYDFPVYTTQVCPYNERGMSKGSLKLNCSESNNYMCVPNENFTKLFEFCYQKSQFNTFKGEARFKLNINIHVCL